MLRYALWCAGVVGPDVQTTAAERACLIRHAQGRRRLAEVGVWQGATTRELRAAMASDGVLFAVDPYPPGALGFSAPEWIARGEVERIQNGRVVWLPLLSVVAAAHPEVVAAPLDFVFIDALHTYEGLRDDWTAWRTRVRCGGVVALHDSRSTHARMIGDTGSVRFTTETILRDPDFRVAEVADSLTVLHRH